MKQPLLLISMSLLWIHPACSQPIIKVCGSEDSLAVKEQVAQYLAHLEVREKVYLSVIFSKHMPEKLEGMTFCLASPETNSYQFIKVRIDARLSIKQQRLVLAHEMIHVKQYAKGELLVLSHQQVMWKGQKFRYKQTQRLYTPWESEAYRTDNLFARRYKEQLEKPFEFEKPLTASKIDP